MSATKPTMKPAPTPAVWEQMLNNPEFYVRTHNAANRTVEREIRRLIRKDMEQ